MIKQIKVSTSKRNQLIDITSQVSEIVEESRVASGSVRIFIPHTTAAVTINEAADPSVRSDITNYLEKLIPVNSGFAHMEGNSDAHIKSSLVGASEFLIIENSRLMLGTWQGIYFCEFDGPRSRRAIIKINSD
ncbi:MAG: YjbQ family protein [candidate division Zixibacteria bacterium]|nr:YjbQ family protein [candidate division Zixibacteria bacterium]